MGYFVLVHALGRRLRNYGIVDPAWALGFAPLACYLAITSPGDVVRSLLLAGLVFLWSLRLAFHLGRRIARLHPREDSRYEQLRSDWAGHFDFKMFLFFQAQALLQSLLLLAFLPAFRNPEPGIGVLETAAALLFLLALGGESLADAQLSAFRSQAGNRGRILDRGLWRYSRHPNYFFEFLVWFALALFCLASPGGMSALLSPALMLLFLLRFTGVRYTEWTSLQSKGAAYRDYQQRTSAFIPWFPKH